MHAVFYFCAYHYTDIRQRDGAVQRAGQLSYGVPASEPHASRQLGERNIFSLRLDHGSLPRLQGASTLNAKEGTK